MKIFFVISVLVLFCGLTIGLVREHIYVNYVNHMEWDDAQTYCRQHYKDLSIITSEEENQVLIEAAGNSLTDSWIGLYRAKRNLWLWSDGQSVSFFKWANGPPYNSSGSPNCCSMDKRGWDGNYCTRNLPFFCYRTLVLVNENKTWDEAHEYCRTHYTGLAGLASDSQLYLDKTDTNFSQAATVWAGLRFLDGQWIWVNGELTSSLVSLPSCPAPEYRCGARIFNTSLWENRNCEERLNFLCY